MARVPSPREIALLNVLVSLPPLRYAWCQRLVMDLRRTRRRRQRLRAEAAGSDALSRPAPYRIQEQLLEVIGPDGFFVEAGAHDGIEYSNTYWLERFHGWRGVLIEPIPALHRHAVAERPDAQVVNCALVSASHTEPTVTLRYAGLMSLVPGARGSEEADDEWVGHGSKLRWERSYEVSVPARTLSSVLDELEAPRPDLLSLDVEGYEAEVLRGLDLERHAPRYLLLELLREDIQDEIAQLLGDRYEPVRKVSEFDMLYRLRDERGGTDVDAL